MVKLLNSRREEKHNSSNLDEKCDQAFLHDTVIF